MGNKKSAKDIAFEKERAKFRSQIRELEREVKNEKLEKLKLKDLLIEKETELEDLKGWIERLLEYTELSEEDMKKIINKDKAISELAGTMRSMNRLLYGLY